MNRREIYVVATVGFLLAAGIGVVLAANQSSPPPQPAAQGFSCMVMGEQDPSDDYCTRMAQDWYVRTKLTESQRAAVTTVGQSLNLPSSECYRGRPCPYQGISREEVVRTHLANAGFRAVVRTARDTDPAPRGSVFFAVDAGEGCLLRWESEARGGGSSEVGKLPSGRCLDE